MTNYISNEKAMTILLTVGLIKKYRYKNELYSTAIYLQ